MASDFNITNFIEEMKACKPPYRCPFDHCGKVYKSSSGIISHIQSCSNEKGKQGTEDSKDSISRPFIRSPQKDSLVYTEAQKMVEFEADGRCHKFSIYDALSLITKEAYEESLPEDFKEKMNKKDEEALSTPVVNKSHKKKGKAPRFSTPKNPNLLPRNMDKHNGQDENRDTQPIDKKMLKLPESQFTEINDYVLKPADPMPDKYYKFVEKTLEELDKEIEYDMDEEDVAWLKIMNDKRKEDTLSKITEDQFELLMDRLEKESYFQVASTGGNMNYTAPVDEDAICCVCMDGEATNTNVILFCDLCNLAVHQECYGVPYIPEGQWLCRRCLQSPSRSVECCLCPNKGGAFKQTDDGRWAHVVCALWIPEVRFANTVFLEPIDSIANIPSARWKLPCRICKTKGTNGACIQCHKNSCFAAFHVTCGLLAGLHMKMETVHENGPGGTSIQVRKSAFCEQHTPADSDAKPKLDDVASLGIIMNKNKKSPKKACDELPILFRGLMNFSPQCPWDKVQKIAGMVDIQKKNQFIQRLMAYWTLKRQTRNGVPLIRRLQFAKATKSESPEDEDGEDTEATMEDKKAPSLASISSTEKSDRESDSSKSKKISKKSKKIKQESVEPKEEPEKELTLQEKALEDFKVMSDERRKMRRLRQDLEKVRLLCELIRKREQRKRELMHVSSDIKFLELNPFGFFLQRILDLLEKEDTQNIFGEPVDPDEVPDYLDLIKKPMDFSTMRSKVELLKYEKFVEFESDFNLIHANCTTYNEKETIYYRAGTRMRDAGGSIIRSSRRLAEQLQTMGEDEGSAEISAEQEELSDIKIMKEFDTFVNDKDRDVMKNDEHLQSLLVYSDMAHKINHPSAKKKRIQLISSEIRKLRRKISLDKSAKGKDSLRKDKDTNKDDDGEGDEVGVEDGEEENSKSVDRAKKKIFKQATKGRKRARSSEEDGEQEEEQHTKDQDKNKGKEVGEKDKEESEIFGTPGNKTRKGATAGGSGISGVNRRTAVLFTRKKAATKEEESKADKKRTSRRNDESADEAQSTPNKKGGKSKKSSTAVGGDEFEFNEPETPTTPASPATAEFKGRKTRKAREMEKSILEAKAERFVGGPKLDDEMFQNYRQGGAVDTDTDTGAESTNDLGTTDDDDSSSESGEDSFCAGAGSGLDITLEPLDLVWAKCRGYPWYPALIINPKMPRTGYFHNGVPIPVPPVEVLNLAETHTKPHYLILFFDTKRTWQWLPRDKLEPLGVDTERDKTKLIQSRKPSERKAVKKAYEEAILHRCRVTGETVDLQSCQTKENQEVDEKPQEKPPQEKSTTKKKK